MSAEDAGTIDAPLTSGSDLQLVAEAVDRSSPPPAGIVLGVGMVLWGIERFLDEHLWLGEDGHLGSLLVQWAGALLAVAGIILLATRFGALQRWRRGEADPAGIEEDDGTERRIAGRGHRSGRRRSRRCRRTRGRGRGRRRRRGAGPGSPARSGERRRTSPRPGPRRPRAASPPVSSEAEGQTESGTPAAAETRPSRTPVGRSVSTTRSTAGHCYQHEHCGRAAEHDDRCHRGQRRGHAQDHSHLSCSEHPDRPGRRAPSKRRWKDTSSVTDRTRRVRSTARPRRRPNQAPNATAASGVGGQDTEDDDKVDGRRGDVGHEPGADLPPEPRPVDPWPVAVEPALVDLPAVHGKLASEEGAVGAWPPRRRRRPPPKAESPLRGGARPPRPPRGP